MKSCKHCKHDSMCESTKSDRTVCTDGSWEFFESLPLLNIFEIENKEAVDKVYIELLKEEFEIVRKQLSDAIEVIKFYAREENWLEGDFYQNRMIPIDSDNNYVMGKRARELLKKITIMYSNGLLK